MNLKDDIKTSSRYRGEGNIVLEKSVLHLGTQQYKNINCEHLRLGNTLLAATDPNDSLYDSNHLHLVSIHAHPTDLHLGAVVGRTGDGTYNLMSDDSNHNAIGIKSHSDATWFRNVAGRWVFQGNNNQDNWTETFEIRATGKNNSYWEPGWIDIGQQFSNETSGIYIGISSRRMSGGTIVPGRIAGENVYTAYKIENGISTFSREAKENNPRVSNILNRFTDIKVNHNLQVTKNKECEITSPYILSGIEDTFPELLSTREIDLNQFKNNNPEEIETLELADDVSNKQVETYIDTTGLLNITIQTLQEEIKIRDEQFNSLKAEIEELKSQLKS